MTKVKLQYVGETICRVGILGEFVPFQIISVDEEQVGILLATRVFTEIKIKPPEPIKRKGENKQ